MNTIYKNEKSQALFLAMAVVGLILIALAALDTLALWPIFGADQHTDIAILLVGSFLALMGLKTLTGTVREIAVGDGNLIVRKSFGTTTIAKAGLEMVSLLGATKESVNVMLTTSAGAWTVPMVPFAAERFVETIKAVNPAAKIERRT